MNAADGGVRVRLAQIGVGHVHAAGKAAVARHTPGAEFVGVFEPDLRRRAACAGTAAYGGVRWFATVDEILADASIQGVLVETSPFEGVAWARRALEAGKHVHLDKAPGTSLADFAQMIDLARGQGLLCQQGYQLRYNPVPDPFVDSTVVVLEFPHAVATIETSALEVRPVEKRRLEVYGSAGSVILDPMEPPTVLLGLEAATATTGPGGRPSTSATARATWLTSPSSRAASPRVRPRASRTTTICSSTRCCCVPAGVAV